MVIFGTISIFGTYSGIEFFGAMANVRDLEPMVAGLIGGPVMGIRAGLIGGLYRLSLGGFTAVPCAISTILSGLLAGLLFMINKRRFVEYLLGCSLRCSHGIPAYASNPGPALYPSSGGK